MNAIVFCGIPRPVALLHRLIHSDLRFIASKLSTVWGSAVRDHRPGGRAPDLDCELGLRFSVNRTDRHDPLWFITVCDSAS